MLTTNRRFVLGLAIGAMSTTSARAELQFIEVGPLRGIQPYTMAPGLGGGVAAADFDDDGDVDLFVPNAEGVPDQLYRNLGGGQFEEIAAAAGLASTDRTRVALWLDLDGDHLLDLFTASDCFLADAGCLDTPTLRLYRQTADAQFEDVTASAGLGSDLVTETSMHRGGVCAGDIDGDGYVDLMIGLWGGEARFFLNNGSAETPGFTDISASCGVGGVTRGHWQPVMHDFDRDGWLDIFSAIDFTANRLWMNQSDGTFVDGAPTAGVDYAWNDMGVTLGDYDNDDDLDVFVTEIFQDGRHHLLFRNDTLGGGPQFAEVAMIAGVSDGDFGWGAIFLDADNDGRLDLAVTNGYFNQPFDTDPSRFFRNLGGDPVTFADVSTKVGFDDTFWGSALVALDYDRDGDLDLVQTCAQAGPLRLLENQLADRSSDVNHLVVRPRMTGPNHRAIGAVVRIETTLYDQMRLITAGISHMSQEPAEAFFGIGAETSVDCVRVAWPDGVHTALANVGANQVLTVLAPTCPLDLDDSGNVATGDLLIILEQWGGPTCHRADADGSGVVDTGDLLALLSAWGACSN